MSSPSCRKHDSYRSSGLIVNHVKADPPQDTVIHTIPHQEQNAKKECEKQEKFVDNNQSHPLYTEKRGSFI